MAQDQNAGQGQTAGRSVTGFSVDPDEEAVVIVGSGAGGGTLAYELTAKGIPVVVLEAGPYLRNEDYVNNEWEAFNQMAWLDPRTTTGSWRIARDFPNLPAWIVKAVGGTTTHWSGATRSEERRVGKECRSRWSPYH